MKQPIQAPLPSKVMVAVIFGRVICWASAAQALDAVPGTLAHGWEVGRLLHIRIILMGETRVFAGWGKGTAG